MKTIFTLVAALMAATVANATVTIGETTYKDLWNAIEAAQDGDVITVSGTENVGGTLKPTHAITIESTDNAVINKTTNSTFIEVTTAGATVALKNLTIQGQESNSVNGSFIYVTLPGENVLTLDNVTFSNVNSARNDRGLIYDDASNSITLKNVAFTNCTTAKDGAEFAKVYIANNKTTTVNLAGTTENLSVRVPNANCKLNLTNTITATPAVAMFLGEAVKMGDNLVSATDNVKINSGDFNLIGKDWGIDSTGKVVDKSTLTGIEDIFSENIGYTIAGRTLSLTEPAQVKVYTIAGHTLFAGLTSEIELPAGLCIVCINGKALKVNIR